MEELLISFKHVPYKKLNEAFGPIIKKLAENNIFNFSQMII